MNRAKGHRRRLLWNQRFASYNSKQRVHNVTHHCASHAVARQRGAQLALVTWTLASPDLRSDG